MTSKIRNYMDGTEVWGALSKQEKVWVLTWKPELCPADERIDFRAH